MIAKCGRVDLRLTWEMPVVAGEEDENQAPKDWAGARRNKNPNIPVC